MRKTIYLSIYLSIVLLSSCKSNDVNDASLAAEADPCKCNNGRIDSGPYGHTHCPAKKPYQHYNLFAFEYLCCSEDGTTGEPDTNDCISGQTTNRECEKVCRGD